ncbi:MAG: hypothetical protein ABIH76_00935 [Candidatus Bathyarchaeota archaeon]
MSIIEKIIKTWTHYGLVWQQKKNIASLQVLENYLTNSILKGDESKKGQLIDIQGKLNESVRFLKFLTNK